MFFAIYGFTNALRYKYICRECYVPFVEIDPSAVLIAYIK